MKIIVWNVNGIRAMLKKSNMIDLINNEIPDIFCIGETKIGTETQTIEDDFKSRINANYFCYWGKCKKLGYSGTAIFSKVKPKKVIYGMIINDNEYDDEGRVITCEFTDFYLIHVYTPNSGQFLARLDYRTETWDVHFVKYINKLKESKKVIVCGDLNVAHNEIDLKNPKSNSRTAGYTIEERNSFNMLLNKTELVDSFRLLQPLLVKYSYWSYRFKSREKNNGWRIDYFLIDKRLIKKIIQSDILTDIGGSDHAPIILEINLK